MNWSIIIAAIGLLLLVTVPTTFARPAFAIKITPPSRQLTAEWWQWALAIPRSTNPQFDSTGAACATHQSGNVWFLAGSAGSDPVIRECTVPAGKAILIPLINVECSSVEPDPFFGKNHGQQQKCVKQFVVGVETLEATIDGIDVQALADFRVQSPQFAFAMPATDNLLFLDGVTSGTSVSDGYWLLISSLSPGKHVIHVAGAFVSGPGVGFEQDVTYKLTVQ